MQKLNVVDIESIPENDYTDHSIKGFEFYVGKTITKLLNDEIFCEMFPVRRIVPYPLGLITADYISDRLTILYDEKTGKVSDRSYMG